MEILKCGVCNLHNQIQARKTWEILRTDLWIVRHHPDPAPLIGWLLLDAKRHITGPIDFNNAEAESWGLIVQKTSTLIKSLTKCDRVYLIAFGEGAKHLHLHLIPRYEKNVLTKSWSIADLYRGVINGSHKAANPNKINALVKEARNLWA